MAQIDRRPAWTPERDETLRQLRRAGASWAAIAAALGVSPAVARERGRRIGAPRATARTGQSPVPSPAARTQDLADDPAEDVSEDASEDPDRPPLPPGHPRAWAVLTEGTLLAGTVWPAGPAEKREPQP